MITIKDNCYKGTRILLGDTKRQRINEMIDILHGEGFTEINIPIIQPQSIFAGKIGEENNNMIFTVKDKSDRELCLAPEYTAVVQHLALNRFKYEKDVRLFYIQECFRGETPQAGRYRQFTQMGIEILNPSEDYIPYLIDLATKLYYKFPGVFEVTRNVKRGLDYYKDGKGFEIRNNALGSSNQICGGGEYEGGVGFALGIDRLLNLLE